MDLQRIEIKFYLEDESSISAEDAFRVFNAWIPETSGETLVDVADYSHVPDGPGTLLVGHEQNYALDRTDRRFGLYCSRKREVDGEIEDRLRSVLVTALQACRRLERESEFAGKLRFRGDELLLTVNDRLNAPNTEETAAVLEPHFRSVLGSMYTGAEVSIARDPDPGQRFNLRVKVAGDFDVDTLLENVRRA